jgi:hypothetical protein
VKQRKNKKKQKTQTNKKTTKNLFWKIADVVCDENRAVGKDAGREQLALVRKKIQLLQIVRTHFQNVLRTKERRKKERRRRRRKKEEGKKKNEGRQKKERKRRKERKKDHTWDLVIS